MTTTCLINRMLGGGILFLLWMFASCTEDRAAETLSGNVVEVTQAIEVSVQPMQCVGSPATRAEREQPKTGEAIHVSYRSDATTRVQDEETDKTVTESTINNAYVLQFDGTSPTAVLRTKVELTPAQVTSGSPIICNFVMTAGVKNRIYVVANCAQAMTEGSTTLADFEGVVALAPATTLPATGLPMSACQDVGVGDAFRSFQLRSLLAKLTFTTNTGTLNLYGLPSGYSFYTQQPGESGVRPVGMDYTSTYTLDSGVTYYVPENLSGQGNFSSPVVRISPFAPANSMYVQISANSTTYNIYLGDGSAGDFNVAGNHSYNVIAQVLAANSIDPRVGTPTITDLSASGTANCYIATATDTWYSFNGTVMGNGATTLVPVNMASTGVASPIIPQPLNPIGADVLWETWNTTTAPDKGSVVSAAYVVNGTILVRTGAQQGNAVVAARDASNTIIWSWHIWRIPSDPVIIPLADIISTDGTFDATGTTTLSGLQIMDRNLGALSAEAQNDLTTGFFYQWGRKDPFPAYAGLAATNNVAMNTVPSDVPIIPDDGYAQFTVSQSISQPTTFRLNAGDWCNPRNDNLWGTSLTTTVSINGNTYNSNKGSKSIYDPCPVGWRVSPGYAFANATLDNCPWSNSGCDFKAITTGASIWFPASGNRNHGTGMLGNGGIEGGSLTSTPLVNNSSFGQMMVLAANYLVSNHGDFRTYGVSIRCAKE